MNIDNVQKDERTEEVPTTPSTGGAPAKKKSSGIVWILILLLALLGIFFVLQYTGVFSTGSDDSGTSSISDDSVVATVNGAKITRGELNEKIEQVRRSLPAGSADPTQDASFELQLLEDLINLKLLTLVAEEKNYTVTNDEVEAEKTLLIESFGGAEALQQQLDTLGITDDELMENMRNELLIRRLLEDETNVESITVTDEEIQTTYDMAVGEAEDAPSLEEVSELIRSELVNQKTAKIVEEYIQEVRAEAEIEKTL